MKLFCSAIMLFFTSYILAQNNDVVDYSDYTRTVYWFDIGIRFTKEKSTGLETMELVYFGKRIKYGNVEQFDKHLWHNLSIGKGIAIGPFNTYKEAVLANKLYNLKNLKKDTTVNLKDGKTYYWYLVKIRRYKRLHSLDFQRMAARIASGDLERFITNIKVALPNFELAIGPFTSQPEAEESKRLYRLEE